jgi:hypothetical protein
VGAQTGALLRRDVVRNGCDELLQSVRMHEYPLR